MRKGQLSIPYRILPFGFLASLITSIYTLNSLSDTSRNPTSNEASMYALNSLSDTSYYKQQKRKAHRANSQFLIGYFRARGFPQGGTTALSIPYRILPPVVADQYVVVPWALSIPYRILQKFFEDKLWVCVPEEQFSQFLIGYFWQAIHGYVCTITVSLSIPYRILHAIHNFYHEAIRDGSQFLIGYFWPVKQQATGTGI